MNSAMPSGQSISTQTTSTTPIRINLGCGNKIRDGFFGVDLYSCAAANVLCDINRPLPFGASTIDEFFLDNVIEHVWMPIPYRAQLSTRSIAVSESDGPK